MTLMRTYVVLPRCDGKFRSDFDRLQNETLSCLDMTFVKYFGVSLVADGKGVPFLAEEFYFIIAFYTYC